MKFQKGLVFYDLEWTGTELLQIGAVCCEDSFERTILTKRDIHPKVTASIFLQTRMKVCVDPPYAITREVYDCQRDIFLPSCKSKDALEQFLTWMKGIKTTCGQIILVSHGNLDIPILHQSFAEHDMDAEFLQTCSHFVNFQEYLREHFVHLPLGLPALVQLCCGDQVYRLHCAVDDARATQDVFIKIHQKKTDWEGNTQLVVFDEEKFGFEFATIKRVRLTFMNYEMGGKEMMFLSIKINPSSIPSLLDDMSDWDTILATLPLFQKVDPPSCHMFSVGGWVTGHHLVEDVGPASTEVELLCSLRNSYFKLFFFPDAKATFGRRKLLLNLPTVTKIPAGTPVTARLKMKAGQVIRVMYIKEGVEELGTLSDALTMLRDVGDSRALLGMRNLDLVA